MKEPYQMKVPQIEMSWWFVDKLEIMWFNRALQVMRIINNNIDYYLDWEIELDFLKSEYRQSLKLILEVLDDYKDKLPVWFPECVLSEYKNMWSYIRNDLS